MGEQAVLSYAEILELARGRVRDAGLGSGKRQDRGKDDTAKVPLW
jgi:hypothetical protein